MARTLSRPFLIEVPFECLFVPVEELEDLAEQAGWERQQTSARIWQSSAYTKR